MRRLAPVLFLVTTLPSGVAAAGSGDLQAVQSPVSPPVGTRSVRPEDEKLKYYSKFGDQVLRRSAVIVQGRVDQVSPVPRGELVRISIEHAFKGADPDVTSVSLFANRGDFFEGGELLLFLEEFQGGPRYTCFNRIPLSDQDYDAKQAHLEGQLLLEGAQDDADRMTMARDLLFQNARSADMWPRRNSLRELAYVLKEYPEMIRDQDAVELRGIAEQSHDEVFQKELLALLDQRDS